MAMVVMAVIIILNIVLLLAVMRIGTMDDHKNPASAEQSGAVRAMRARLAARDNDQGETGDSAAAAVEA